MEKMDLDNTTQASANITDTRSNASHHGYQVATGLITVSPEEYKLFTIVCTGVLTPVICILGCTGNSLGLNVLLRSSKRKRLTIHVYMCSLMVVNIAYLSVGIVDALTQMLDVAGFYFGHVIQKHVRQWIGYCDMTLNHTSSALLIILSADRLLALVCPFIYKDTWLAKYPRTVIWTCFIGSAVYLLPFGVCLYVMSFKNDQNQTRYVVRLRPGTQDFMVHFSLTETIILHYICPVVVLTINAAIPISYSRILKRRATTIRAAMSQGNQQVNQQIKLTIMVTAVSIMYLFLSLPNLFIQTLIFIDQRYSFYGPFRLTFSAFIQFGDLLARFNAMTVFLIYIWVSTQYRTLFSTMYCTCCLSHDIEIQESQSDVADKGEKYAQKKTTFSITSMTSCDEGTSNTNVLGVSASKNASDK